MNEIKNKAIYLLFFCFIAFNCNAWLGSESIKKAIKEHDELYLKFAPERESTDIKVDLTHQNLGALIKVIFQYTPETPHCKSYFEALENLENKVYVRSLLKGFFIGLPVGVLNFYALLKNRNIKKTLGASAISGVLFSILNVIYENKSYGKHPYFDRFLKKYDNYFDNLGIETITRMIASYGMFLLGGFLGAGTSIAVSEKLK